MANQGRPLLGPADRDWWTVELDFIPGDEEIIAHSMNRHTLESREYRIRVRDYANHNTALAVLFAEIRDTFMEV